MVTFIVPEKDFEVERLTLSTIVVQILKSNLLLFRSNFASGRNLLSQKKCSAGTP